MKFDRRDLIRRFGFAGLVAGTLMGQRGSARAATAPRRLLLFYTPAGFFSSCWQPAEPWAGESAAKSLNLPLSEITFGRIRAGNPRQNILDVLDEPKYVGLKEDLLVIDGVDMRGIERGDVHPNGIKAALRGRPILTDDPGPFPNMSIDRVIGANLFQGTQRPVRLKSANLNLGLGNYGQQGAIRDCSEGGTSLEPTRIDQMWDLLFQDFMPGMAGGTAPTGPSPALSDAWERRKLLSSVSRGELEGLKRRLGADERLAMDRHLEAMNEITLQVENSYKSALARPATGAGPRAPVPARPNGALDPKYDLVAMSGLAAGSIANAMAHDRIRVAVIHTFGQTNNTSYWYPGSTGGYHDGVAHGGLKVAQVVPAAMSAGRTLLRMYLDILLAFKAIPEGSGTLLDSTTVATFSDMSNGDHLFKVPGLFLLGGGGGLGASGGRHWRTGRYAKFVDRGHNDLLVSLAHGMGVTEAIDGAGARQPLTQIGSARYNNGPLPGLTA